MIKAVIIDDEPLAHEIIVSYTKEIHFLTITAQYYSATEALTALSEDAIDLMFLDIQMPMLTGLELLRVLKNRPQVILTTAYQEHALEGYELDVADYLLKPFHFARFLQAVNKVQARIGNITLEKGELEKPSEQSIFIKVDKKQVLINLADISLLEAYGNYVKVWRGTDCLLTPRTLTSFEQSLPQDMFLRVHKSTIVSRIKIDYIQGDKLVLTSGTHVSIGKQYRTNLNQILR